jgi:hypothetical protein
MLLIDYSIRQPKKSIEEGSLESRAYYFEDPIRIIKMYKRWILPEYNEMYDKILNETTRKYTTIAFRLDMIMRIRRYGLLPENELILLQQDVNKHIENKNERWKSDIKRDCKKYLKEDKTYKDFQVSSENIDDVYSNVQILIKEEAKKGVIEMEKNNMVEYKNILNIAVYQMRAIEVQIQIPKTKIQKRKDEGYMCPFFSVDLKDLTNLYWKGLNCLLDPINLLTCFYKVCTQLSMEPRDVIKVIFNKERYKIFYFVNYRFFNEIVKKKQLEDPDN